MNINYQNTLLIVFAIGYTLRILEGVTEKKKIPDEKIEGNK